MTERGHGGIRIRPAGPDDLPRARALFEELDRHQSDWRVFAARSNLGDEVVERYRAAQNDFDTLHLVAEEQGALIGMALGRVQAISSISDDRVMEVSNVIVLPSHRRRGVARALIRVLASFAGERGAERLAIKTYAQNDDAMRFWEALGFHPRYVQMTATVEEVGPPTL